MKNRLIIAVLASFSCTAASQPADFLPVRNDTPSGFPVPRYVSLKYNKTNCRSGPSRSYDIRFTFLRKGAPVLVIAETTDHWRKIEDRDGDQCWAHKTVLAARNHAYSTKETHIFSRPDSSSNIRGRIAPDVMVAFIREQEGWSLIAVNNLKGWIPYSVLWGATQYSQNNAAHN